MMETGMRQPGNDATLRSWARRGAMVLALGVAAAMSGCSDQELYGKLTERQANEMVAVLQAAGLEGVKQQREDGFIVSTSQTDFARAVQTLHDNGQPREQFDSLGDVFKREGFVSTPLEEHARLLHALSQEMSNTLANIDGVLMARVHLVVPERNPLIDKPQPAGASVFIKYRPDVDMAAAVPQIKALVVNSVEGLPYDNVTVALFPAERWPLAAAVATAPPAAAVGGGTPSLAQVLWFGVAGGATVLAGAGAVAFWRRRQAPTTDALPPPHGALHALDNPEPHPDLAAMATGSR